MVVLVVTVAIGCAYKSLNATGNRRTRSMRNVEPGNFKIRITALILLCVLGLISIGMISFCIWVIVAIMRYFGVI